MQLREVVAPVDLVEEPVHDQQKDGDRDQRDDRLELLAVASQRAEHGLCDHEGGDRRDERADGSEEHRSPEAALRADQPAVSAARISTASSPSRKTMMAVFEITENVDCGPEPTAASASASA